MKVKFIFIKYYRLLWLFLAKNSTLLAKIPFVYLIWQKFFRIPKLKKILNEINNSWEKELIMKFNENEELVINEFVQFNNTEKIYIIFPFASIWEYALSFLILRTFLDNYKWKVLIICPQNTLDIAKIFWIYFNIFKYIMFPTWLTYCNIETLKWYIDLNDINTINMWDILFNKIWIAKKIPLKNNKRYWFFYGPEDFEKKYITAIHSWKFEFIKTSKYEYTGLDLDKLKGLSWYENWWKLIICNFESKSFNSCIDDGIKFSDYMNIILSLSDKSNIKFVVNSVYNNEKLFKNDNILITRLNFQEIIWLAEHDKIDLFISERNWLNDFFYAFYPKINQIILYPDYYIVNVSKKLFNKQLGCWYNLINDSYLDWKLNFLRKDCFYSMEKFIVDVLK